MALIQCKECKSQVSDIAKTCPSCGAAVPKPTGRLAIFIASVFGLIVFSSIYRSTSAPTPQAAIAATQTTTTQTKAIVAELTSSTKEWEYINQPDAMTGKPKKIAKLLSSNSLNLDFPYKGDNNGILIVRQANTTDVLFSIQKGQIICDNYRDCSLNIRFDDNQPQKFSASKPEDMSSTLLFINDTKRFIAAAQKAKSIKVQAVIFNQGSHILEFDTDKLLVWPQK